MSNIKIAINGFGRIGRLTFKSLQKMNNVEVVAINDLTDAKTLAHLLKYDSVHGKYPGEVSYENEFLIVDGKRYRVYAEKDPAALPWKDLGVDVVLNVPGYSAHEKKWKSISSRREKSCAFGSRQYRSGC